MKDQGNKTLPLEFQDWGLIEYDQALSKQLALAEKVYEEKLPGYLIFCTHPPIVTLGRATQPEDVYAWSGPTLEVSRGGRATYHGPSQLVIYPIVNLNFPRHQRKEKEVVGLLRSIEEAIIETLESYGIVAEGKSILKNSSSLANLSHPTDKPKLEDTGVWVKSFEKSQKIASLGMAVKNWVSYHGAAINVFFDPKAFQGLNPCGYQANVMVSLEEVLDCEINFTDFKERLFKALSIRI